MYMSNIQSHIIFRLTLAKILFKRGKDLVEHSYNVFDVSQGLISIHDSLDNFTGAVMNSLKVSRKTKSQIYLMDALDIIEGEERSRNAQFRMHYKQEIAQLNTIRNNLKHQGITPNIQQSKLLIIPIEKFLDEYSHHFFKLSWLEVSMADLVRDRSARAALKKAGKFLTENKYKEALDEIALAKFKAFEEKGLTRENYFDNAQTARNYAKSIQPDVSFSEQDNEKEPRNIFYPDGSMFWPDQYKQESLIDEKIDREILKKVEELSARVGFNNFRERRYIFKHGKNWGQPNWTEENALFCYDAVIDAIIKKQGRHPGFTEKTAIYEYQIKIIKGNLRIYCYKDCDKKISRVLKRGGKYKVLLEDLHVGKWEVYDKISVIELLDKRKGEMRRWLFKNNDKNKIKILEVTLRR